jgi:hypothetical protein
MPLSSTISGIAPLYVPIAGIPHAIASINDMRIAPAIPAWQYSQYKAVRTNDTRQPTGRRESVRRTADIAQCQTGRISGSIPVAAEIRSHHEQSQPPISGTPRSTSPLHSRQQQEIDPLARQKPTDEEDHEILFTETQTPRGGPRRARILGVHTGRTQTMRSSWTPSLPQHVP